MKKGIGKKMNLENKIMKRFLDSFDKQSDYHFHFEKEVKELMRCRRELVKKREPEYKGVDITETELTASCQKIKDKLTLEELQGYYKNNEIGITELLLICAMQIGINQGLIRGKQKGKQELLAELLSELEI